MKVFFTRNNSITTLTTLIRLVISVILAPRHEFISYTAGIGLTTRIPIKIMLLGKKSNSGYS